MNVSSKISRTIVILIVLAVTAGIASAQGGDPSGHRGKPGTKKNVKTKGLKRSNAKRNSGRTSKLNRGVTRPGPGFETPLLFERPRESEPAKKKGKKGEAALAVQEPKTTQEPARKVARPMPNDAFGDALLRDRKYTEAEDFYRKALQLNPDRAENNYKLGVALLGQNKFAEAEPYYRKALLLEAQSPLKSKLAEYHNGLGDDLRRQEKYQEASNEYREAVRLDPNNLEYEKNFKETPVPASPLLPKSIAVLRHPEQRFPDFSGIWVFDKSKSTVHTYDYASSVTWEIKQDPDHVTIAFKIIETSGNLRSTRPKTYNLNGTESIHELEYGGGSVRLKARMTASGTLELTDESPVITRRGTGRSRLYLSVRNKVLNVDSSVDGPGGAPGRISTLVFSKQ